MAMLFFYICQISFARSNHYRLPGLCSPCPNSSTHIAQRFAERAAFPFASAVVRVGRGCFFKTQRPIRITAKLSSVERGVEAHLVHYACSRTSPFARHTVCITTIRRRAAITRAGRLWLAVRRCCCVTQMCNQNKIHPFSRPTALASRTQNGVQQEGRIGSRSFCSGEVIHPRSVPANSADRSVGGR